MTPKVTELAEPPVVGNWYLVPVVRAFFGSYHGTWPVFPIHHEDSKHFQFDRWHFHIDGRFLNGLAMKRVSAYARRVYQGRGWEGAIQALPISHDHDRAAPEIEWKRIRCVRVGVDYKYSEEISAKLTPDYLGKVCPKGASGWICPHKGQDLSSMVPDKFGNVTCPLHGLQINAVSGIVVGPRPLKRDTVRS